jgi:phage portal protein BeeE
MAARKKPESSAHIEIINVGVPSIPIERKASQYSSSDVIPFGSDNQFPQALALLTRRSPVQRAVITNKSYYINGSGFVADENQKVLQDLIKSVNAKESLANVTHKLIIDKLTFGNAYIELVKVGSTLSMYHQDATACRVHKDGDKIVINPSWAKYEKKDSVILPIYPVFAKVNGAMRSMVHIKDYEPEFKTYGIPQWIAAMDAAAIAYKTNKWNVSRLDNSFQSSGVLLIDGNISQDDAVKLKKKFKDEFTGEGNQGKIMFIAQNLGGKSSTTWTPVASGNEGDWMQLHKQSTDEIITANNWYPSLSGIATAGALGSTQQIRNEYQIALNTVITHEQGGMIRVLSRLISEQYGVDSSSLAVVNKPPISALDLVNLNTSIKKWEVRKMAGLAYDETDEDQQQWNVQQSTPITNV